MWGKGWDEPYSPPVLLSLMGTAALSDGDVENPCLIGQQLCLMGKKFLSDRRGSPV